MAVTLLAATPSGVTPVAFMHLERKLTLRYRKANSYTVADGKQLKINGF